MTNSISLGLLHSQSLLPSSFLCGGGGRKGKEFLGLSHSPALFSVLFFFRGRAAATGDIFSRLCSCPSPPFFFLLGSSRFGNDRSHNQAERKKNCFASLLPFSHKRHADIKFKFLLLSFLLFLSHAKPLSAEEDE